MNVSLQECFLNMGRWTNKAAPKRPHRPYHSYGRMYDLIFSAQKHNLNRPLSMLEIGIDFGGSTAVFLKLDSNHLRELVAIDVDDKRRRAYRLLMDDEKRCRFHTMDAYEESTVSFLSKNYEGFDIIIDDGPHTWESQRFFFENYYKLLNDGGLLVCEDVKYSYLPEVKKLRDEHDFNLFIVDLHDNTKNDANLDDMMVLRYKN